jgi:hypothetical protein
LFKKILGPKLGKPKNYWKITTCDKPQKEKPNRKKNQTNKQTIQGTCIDVFGGRS